jgi:hypothetical protein
MVLSPTPVAALGASGRVNAGFTPKLIMIINRLKTRSGTSPPAAQGIFMRWFSFNLIMRQFLLPVLCLVHTSNSS